MPQERGPEEYIENPEWIETVQECERIMLSAGERGINFLFDPTIEGFLTDLKEQHPEFRKTRLYHVIYSSTPHGGTQSPKSLDLPDKKIETFIKEVVDKLGR